MKKELLKGMVLGFTCAVSLMSFSSVFGDTIAKTIEVTQRNIRLIVDSQAVSFEEEHDIFIYEEKTYVPLRTFGEVIGKNIDWDENSGTIFMTSVEDENTNNSSNASQNNNDVIDNKEESKPTESKPTESKPTESKPTESKPTNTKQTGAKKEKVIEIKKRGFDNLYVAFKQDRDGDSMTASVSVRVVIDAEIDSDDKAEDAICDNMEEVRDIIAKAFTEDTYGNTFGGRDQEGISKSVQRRIIKALEEEYDITGLIRVDLMDLWFLGCYEYMKEDSMNWKLIQNNGRPIE